MSAVAANGEEQTPAVEDAARRFAGLLPLARSLLINLLGPYLVYRALETVFPAPSAIPLLGSTLVPAVDLAVVFARRRAIDTIAVISLVQLLASLAITVVTRSPHAAMAGHALQPAVLGVVFAASALAGRNLMIPLARQTMAGDDPVRQARFDSVSSLPPSRRRFAVIAWIWAVALCGQTVVQLLMLQRLSTKDYLLAANLLGYCVTGVLIWASIRYGRWIGRRHRDATA